jgi:hypothetical protein
VVPSLGVALNNFHHWADTDPASPAAIRGGPRARGPRCHRDAFGVIGTTFRDLGCKPLIFSREHSNSFKHMVSLIMRPLSLMGNAYSCMKQLAGTHDDSALHHLA